MKKYLLYLFLIWVIILNHIQAQTYTTAFDSVFAHVSRVDATTGILYERVLPFANLTNYNSTVSTPDTSDSDHFFRAYNDIYHATFSPSINMMAKDSLIKLAETNADIIQIGILHFNFNTFDTAIIHQKLYFDTDSVLHENTNVSSSLYSINTLFIASPLKKIINTNNASFVLTNPLYFDNTQDSIIDITIDFNNDMGFQQLIIGKTINIEYSTDGIKVLHFKAILNSGTIMHAYATLVVETTPQSSLESVYPYVDNFVGNNAIEAEITPPNPYDGGVFSKKKGFVRIYYACSDKVLRKPLLIIDGFDPQNERQFETSNSDEKKSLWEMFFYNDRNNQVKHLGLQLINMGYDLVLLDFPEGGTYIEQNAMVCIEVLNRLNNLLHVSGSNEQIVVVGPSMGGQIARYALTFMEQNPNENTNGGIHNTRLWVSYDSPHQGANISMGAQYLIETFAKEGSDSGISLIWNKTLCCSAAKQMLKHHADPSAQCLFDMYYNHLHALNPSTNGYPSFLRKISVANGSINNIHNGTAYQIAFQGTVYAPLNLITPLISLPPLPFCSLNVRIRNMVNSGIGEVLGFTVWISFIPIHINKKYTNNFGNSSPDVAPGGTYDTFDQVYRALKRIPVIGALTNVSINHKNHCFMPITSTLDISGSMNYCTDISSRDLVAEGLTPFDSYAGVMDSNMYHVTFDQHLVDYMLNEVETYIQGPREVQLCTRPTYTLHLPQDSAATVTWLCSDSVRLITGSNPYEVTVVPLATGDGWISAEVSTLKHCKRLANYPIHITQNSLPEIDTVSYVTDTLQVNTTMLLGGTLSVDSNKTLLVSGTLHCAPLSRIIVKPGGKLIVDGGTLTSACEDGMWQGVYVEGHRDQPQTAANQGTVQLINGAVVENAHCAITTAIPPLCGGTPTQTDLLPTGGIITADSATFRNCAKAVEYLSYAGTNYAGQVMDNKGSFTNCTFTVDDNNLFAANGTDLLAHVSLWDVKGVEFTHCRFEDARTGNHSRKSAISALDAGFEMKTGCSYSVPRPECDCPPASSTHSSFEGFGTAIDAGTSGSPYEITIDGAQFSDNITGVRIEGSSHATVTRCTFDLSDMPVRVVSGLCLDGCTGYLVEENTFTRGASAPNGSRYGVRVGNSGTSANGLYRNTFERLSHGIYVTGTNGEGNSNTGLQMTCNGFTSNIYDIYVASGATMGPSQGSSIKGADNMFSGSQTSSLYNAGSQRIDYYYSTGTNHALQNPVGNVTLHTNAGSNDCASTLCVLDPSIPGPGPKSPTPSFLALKQQYENLMADFNRNGYADILSTAIPPQSGGTPNVNQETIEAAQYASQQINSIASELYAQSHERVRALMADTLEDLQAVMAWLDATPGLASRYLEAETEFKLGGNNISLADIANHIATQEERDEYDNYIMFSTLKDALRYGNGHVMWPNATDAQIGELVRIADANTGRSSLLAKNVLCFFFGICYDDDMELRELTTTIPPQAEPPALTGQQNITVHPNPTDDVLHVTVTDGDAKIARVEMFDMFGRNISVETHDRASLPSPQTTVNTSSLPSGLYILRVTLRDGTVRNIKIMKNFTK